MADIFFHPLIRLDVRPLEYFSVLGRALFTAQHFETNCRALAGYLKVRMETATKGPDVLDSPEFRHGMVKFWKQTLGRYIQEMGEIPDEIAHILDDARKARNELAHSVAVGIADEQDIDSEMSMRINEIRTYVEKIAVADKYIAAVIHAFNQDPLPNRQFLDEYEDNVADWVCEPAFDK